MKDRASLRRLVGAYQPKIVSVPVPELGDTWYVRELCGAAWVETSDKMREWDEAHQGHAYFASRVVCDATGRTFFEETDVPWLAELPGPVLARIWTIGGDLNHLTARAEEATRKNCHPCGASCTERPANEDTPAPTT